MNKEVEEKIIEFLNNLAECANSVLIKRFEENPIDYGSGNFDDDVDLGRRLEAAEWAEGAQQLLVLINKE